MLASNLAWNLWCVLVSNQPLSDGRPENGADTIDGDTTPQVIDHADRWIFGVWIGIALIAVAILPFAARFKEVAVAIASFCGVSLG